MDSRRVRALVATACAALVFGCQPEITGPGLLDEGPLRIRPVLQSAIDPEKLGLDSLHVVIRRSSDAVVVHEATLPFERDAIVGWVLSLEELPDVLDVDAEVRSGTVAMFAGLVEDIDIVEETAAASGTVHEVTLAFVGPGHDAASVEVDPGRRVLAYGQTQRFHATVKNGAGEIIPNAIVEWLSSAPQLVPIDDDGEITAPSVRAVMQVLARTANGTTGLADVRFQPLLGTLTVLEGDGEEAPVAETLPVIVQVLGEDGIGVEDVEVEFAAPPGASVTDAVVTTDEDGLASTEVMLGTLPGDYVFTASVAGPSSADIVITAHPGPPAALAVDLDGSTGEPGGPLAPGVRVSVVDAYGNLTTSSPAVSMALGTNPAAALLSGTTSVHASAGLATFTDLVLSRHGTGFTLVASAPGLSSGTSAPFAVVQIPRSVEVTPAEQEVHALGALPAGFVALARDLAGEPIAGQAFVWSSSDTDVATVDETGAVTAVANGNAHVRASIGTLTGSAQVIVEQRPDRVDVTPSGRRLTSIGEEVELTATVVDSNGFPVSVLDGGGVTWTSTDESFVTVDASGVATAVGNGNAEIQAAAGPAVGSATITVEQVVASVVVTPGDGSLTALEQQLDLEAEGLDANGFLVAGATFDWSSDSETIASVDDGGLVTALANGDVTIRATSGGVFGTASLTVAQVIAAVSVDPPAHTLTALRAGVQLTATAEDANGHPVANAAFDWSSSAAGVASVDADGLVTAESNGPATITVAAGGIEASTSILVAQAAHAVLVTPGSVTLHALHATQDLDATVVDANGFTVPAAEVIWSVGPEGVASVSTSGLVKALANGSTTARATAGSVFGTASVIVDQRVASIELSVECAGFAPPAGVSGPAGVVPPPTSCDTLVSFGDQARVVAVVRDANGFPVSNAAIAWTSSAPNVAPVDDDGLVIATGNGTTTITAEADGVEAEMVITVRQEVVWLTVEPSYLYLELGEQGQLTARPTDANGYLVADAVVSWRSPSGIASVNADGLVTALAAGQGSVFAEYDGLKAWATVSVTP